MNPAVSIVDQYCFDVYVGSKNIAGTKKGKLDIAPLNHLPLLPSGPGGFDRSWSYKTYPLQKYNFFLYRKHSNQKKMKIISYAFITSVNP